MKSALILIGTGLAVVLVSLVTWMVTGGSVDAGDADRIEASLTPSPLPAEPADSGPEVAELLAEPSPATADRQAPPTIEESTPTTPAIPQFTIGQSPVRDPRVPVQIRIPALDQVAPINPAGVAANGDMEVPDNVTDVAWYKYGASPGEAGSAVLAAHVDLAGQGPGVFFELRELEPGSEIIIDFDDGSSETWLAEARTTYKKDDLPTEAIFSREGPPILTLVTCGGGFNEQIRRYDSNIVVYAVPADTETLERTA